ncbi:MAG: hypothetical protein J5621_02360 [Paludibacteraceae bacterium]|nr:hypothetical protein [Paludibacteraceae bacterium]
MRNKVLKSLVIALCAISLVGCDRWEVYSVALPCPSFIEISGSITDEAGAPLNSVVIYADTTNLNLTKKSLCNGETIRSFKNDGQYYVRYSFAGHLKVEEWPSELLEVTIIAEDTTGVYESQNKTMPVDVRARYPENSTWNYLVDGYATIDFVMKKK